MGRSTRNTNTPSSPIKIYIQFQADSEKGYFVYWDGTKEVSMESIDIILMETRQSIGGFSKSHKKKIYSNIVRNTKEILSVRCDGDTLFTGNYADNKEKIKALGGKFQTNVYCFVKLDDELKAANVQLSGAAVGAWMNFLEEHPIAKVYDSMISISKGSLEVNGKVKYYLPSFELTELDPQDGELATEFDQTILQPWLASIDARQEEREPETVA